MSLESAAENINSTCTTLPFPLDLLYKDEVPDDDKLSAVVAPLEQLWPNGKELTYCFVSGKYQGTVEQQTLVSETIKEWERYTSLTFTHVTRQDATIRIKFQNEGKEEDMGDWSGVGTDIANTSAEYYPLEKATMNLERVTQNKSLAEIKGTILHEFGHTLGLFHEHQSPVRDDSITLLEEGVYAAYRKYDRSIVFQNIMKAYDKSTVSNYSEFDRDSIMLYGLPGQAIQGGVGLHYNYTLSNSDKAFMLINYPRTAAHPDTPDWTFDRALDIAKADDPTKAKLKELLASNQISELRVAFSTFVKVQQSLRAPGQ